MTAKKEATVTVNLDLGPLKSVVKKAARAHGVTMNEFICNAINSHVRQGRDYEQRNHTPHGGKHLFGKHTGYEVTEDGKYYPAPTWIQTFEQLFAERGAITNLANAVLRQSQERLVEVEKQIQQAKNRLVDDLGLDPDKSWVYYGGPQMYLTEAKPEAESEEQ